MEQYFKNNKTQTQFSQEDSALYCPATVTQMSVDEEAVSNARGDCTVYCTVQDEKHEAASQRRGSFRGVEGDSLAAITDAYANQKISSYLPA